ncbi:MAG: hypothetical protein EKK29_08355 [Hyphomicrobiales bacterium]|nr:MAG: hypothetical protein EKK29_08355 [Hyphomicrobiales bacterium]
MENGRCYRHGGRTPKGDAWHKATLPIESERFHGKVADLQRRKAKQDRRREAMMPEERERHREWHKARTPGPKTARQAAREERRRAKEARDLLAQPRPEPPPDREEHALEALIDALKRQQAALEAQERERLAIEELFS